MTPLNPEIEERLTAFEALLLKWNARINLISAKDVPHVRKRHIEDSLRLAHFISPNRQLLDLGSGGGFPAIVLGIVLGLEVTLIESDQRKCAFLREAARVCGVRATIRCCRIEDITFKPVSLVTARALAPLPVLLEWTSRVLRPQGEAYFLKGRSINAELEEARRLWTFEAQILDEPAAFEGVILKVSDIRKAG